MINCFTFSPFVGITSGIVVNINVPTTRNDGSVYHPHLKIGPEFIMVDKLKTPSIEDGVLYEAEIREVIPTVGRSFTTLARAEGSSKLFVFVDLFATPTGVHRKVDPAVVQAWIYFYTDGVLVRNHIASGQALIAFTKDEQSALLFDRDGAVYNIVRHGQRMQVVLLSRLQMAEERVGLMRQQIGTLTGTPTEIFRRRDAILSGAIRLLKVVAHDEEVRSVFVDFLLEYADGQMGTGIREHARSILREVGDLHAYMLEGSDNVLLFHKQASKAKPRLRAQKLADRRARDQKTRAAMRGSSNGGGKQNRQTQKK